MEQRLPAVSDGTGIGTTDTGIPRGFAPFFGGTAMAHPPAFARTDKI
jgi:hypothetical protein